MKTLTVVDDCSKESVQIVVDTSIPALYVTRVLDQVKAERGLPKVIRTDNGPEFAGRTMQTWAARNGVELRFIQPGKPVQNAYIESFNSRFRDECLSQHWFASLSHMRSVHRQLARGLQPPPRRTAPSGYVPPAVFAARCRQLAGGTAQTPHHQLRCKPPGSRAKCYETWGQRTRSEVHEARAKPDPSRNLNKGDLRRGRRLVTPDQVTRESSEWACNVSSVGSASATFRARTRSTAE